MNCCLNPFCKTDIFVNDDDSDLCPECQKTSCHACLGWHTWDGNCPFCRGTGLYSCVYEEGGEHCTGCQFKGHCEVYEDYMECLERDIEESRLVDIARGK